MWTRKFCTGLQVLFHVVHALLSLYTILLLWVRVDLDCFQSLSSASQLLVVSCLWSQLHFTTSDISVVHLHFINSVGLMCISRTTESAWIYSPSREMKAQEKHHHTKDACQAIAKWNGCVKSLWDPLALLDQEKIRS